MLQEEFKVMSKDEIETMKKELGLEGISDKDILKIALECSKEMKAILLSEGTNLNNKGLIDNLSKADEVILSELIRVESIKSEDVSDDSYEEQSLL